MDWRINDGLVIGGAAVVLLSVVALSAMWRTEFETTGSLADWILAGCASIGVVTSAVGLFLLLKTLNENRVMSRAAQRTNEDTRWQKILENRPFLMPVRINVLATIGSNTLHFELNITNEGRHEARDIDFNYELLSNLPRNFWPMAALREKTEFNRQITSGEKVAQIRRASTRVITFTQTRDEITSGAMCLLCSVAYKYEYARREMESYQTSFYLSFKDFELDKPLYSNVYNVHGEAIPSGQREGNFVFLESQVIAE